MDFEEEKNAHLVGGTAADFQHWSTQQVKSIILMFALALPPAGFVQCIPLLVCKGTANSHSLLTYGFTNFCHPLQPSLDQTEGSQSVHCSCLSQLLCQYFIWFCCVLVLYKNGLESCHSVILNLTLHIQILQKFLFTCPEQIFQLLGAIPTPPCQCFFRTGGILAAFLSFGWFSMRINTEQ